MSAFQEQYIAARLQREQRILERALADSDFRSALVADPRAAVAKEFGIEVPEDVDVKVYEEPKKGLYVVLPELSAMDELDEEMLETVAGGWWVELLWSGICFGTGDGPAPATKAPDVTVAAG